MLPSVWVTALALPEKKAAISIELARLTTKRREMNFTLALVAKVHVLAVHGPGISLGFLADLKVPVAPVVNFGVRLGSHYHQTTERSVLEGP